MRYLTLLLLAACTPATQVAAWTSTRPGVTESILVKNNGDISYVSTSNGSVEKGERQRLSREQINELGDVLKSYHTCTLKSAPDYTPEPGEGTTTLELSFPDLQCKVTLYNREWRTGTPRDISDTMRSMRTKPARPN